MSVDAGRALLAALVTASLACGGGPGPPPVVEVELPGQADDHEVGPPVDPGGPPAVHLVRVVRNAPLGALLVDQLALANEAGERLIVMTNAEGCRPCRRFLRALGDPAVRDALAGVLVVRVDVARYKADLAPLGLESYVMPAFFLLDERGHARDGITGSEWTDDVPANIAPVIGAFAREAYAARRAPSTR